MTKKSSAHTLEYILLGLIREEPSHGYALYERLKNSRELSLIWQVKRSKLYYLLDKSVGQGYLSSTIAAEGPYPERKVYTITASGLEALEDWLHTPVRSSRYVRLAFLSKLYFLYRVPGQGAENLIQAQIAVCEEWLQHLSQEAAAHGRDDFISGQVYRFRMGQIEAMVEWLENCRDSLPG